MMPWEPTNRVSRSIRAEAIWGAHVDGARHGWGPGPFHIGISGWRYPPWRGVFYPIHAPFDSIALAHRLGVRDLPVES